ncbi:MAG: aspartate kinase [Pelagibacteraceae bacterium]
MLKKVLKFGGTSVGSIDRIVNATKIVQKEHSAGNRIIVIVSAMSGKTNELIDQSKAISKNFTKRELDVLLTSGEQITSALFAGALNELGLKAKSWMNWQIPILTEGNHANSRIVNININKINEFLSEGGIAVIPGFQGISSLGEITTIGRGGSDATAVAVAKIFSTDSCEIYTDVDGVYSTDPNKVPVAKKIEKISYEEMLELSSLGAKVMQPSAVQTAMMYNIPLEVKSTFTNRKGTEIFNKENIDYTKSITGVAYSKDDAKITLVGVQDKPGVAADIFGAFEQRPNKR